jgi:hypothetical protein
VLSIGIGLTFICFLARKKHNEETCVLPVALIALMAGPALVPTQAHAAGKCHINHQFVDKNDNAVACPDALIEIKKCGQKFKTKKKNVSTMLWGHITWTLVGVIKNGNRKSNVQENLADLPNRHNVCLRSIASTCPTLRLCV